MSRGNLVDKDSRLGLDQQATYRIRVQGRVNKRWATWFDGMTMTCEGADRDPAITTLSGTVADQAALVGLLHKLYTLGFPLLEVWREADNMDDSICSVGTEEPVLNKKDRI